MYAQITREMVLSQHFTSLTYQEEPYSNKSPLFFWVLAFSTGLFGENEIALRLPGALFSFGIMALTYALGKALFSRTAAFWAALLVPTTHVFLWYGRRVLFDSMLTFFITLALLAWVRAHIQKLGSWWYVASFLSMALAAMTKGLHGYVLPLVVIAVFLVITKDATPFKKWSVWIGLFLSVSLMTAYSLSLDVDLQKHFNPLKASRSVFEFVTVRPSTERHPIYWYLLIMWFDFFPWCALVPSSLLAVLSKRPLRPSPAEAFVLAWVLGMFLALSVSSLKREPYLMSLVPGLGLMIGYYRQTISDASEQNRWATWLLRLLLALLAVAFTVALFAGPSLLHRRWSVEPALFPVVYVLVMIVLSIALIYSAVRSDIRRAFQTIGALAIGFAFGVVQFVLPAIDQAGSARQISEDIKAIATNSAQPIHSYSPRWPKNEDAIYYLNLPPALPRIPSEDALIEIVRETGHVSAVMDKTVLNDLRTRVDLTIDLVREFPRPRDKGMYLLTVQVKKPAEPDVRGGRPR